jgi:hypothetical protein
VPLTATENAQLGYCFLFWATCICCLAVLGCLALLCWLLGSKLVGVLFWLFFVGWCLSLVCWGRSGRNTGLGSLLFWTAGAGCFLLVGCRGCSGDKAVPTSPVVAHGGPGDDWLTRAIFPPTPPAPNPDDTEPAEEAGPVNKANLLVGRWRKEGSEMTAEFTAGGNAVFTGGKVPPAATYQRRKEVNGTRDLVRVSKNKHDWADIAPDFVSPTELVLVVTYDYCYGQFQELSGRWRRVSPAPGPSRRGSPADANAHVEKLEGSRQALQRLLDKALAGRDDVVARMRDAGVKSPEDMRGNTRARERMPQLRRVTREIEGLERQITRLDNDILNAKALARRREQEKARVNEAEGRKTADELRQADERLDGKPAGVMPFDDEEALRKAFNKGGR